MMFPQSYLYISGMTKHPTSHQILQRKQAKISVQQETRTCFSAEENARESGGKG